MSDLPLDRYVDSLFEKQIKLLKQRIGIVKREYLALVQTAGLRDRTTRRKKGQWTRLENRLHYVESMQAEFRVRMK